MGGGWIRWACYSGVAVMVVDGLFEFTLLEALCHALFGHHSDSREDANLPF